MTEQLPQVSFEWITPQKAKEFLGKNLNNRSLSISTVKKYAMLMRRDEWDGMNGESIKFDSSGRMTDGQHRCRAIILANKPVKMMVVRGLSPQSKETIDQGRHRSLSDVLSMRGYSNSGQLSSLSRAIVRKQKYGLQAAFIASGAGGKYPYTNGECLQVVEAHEDQLREAIRITEKVCRLLHVPIVVFATICYELLNYDNELTTSFFNQIRNGENLKTGDPIYALRSVLLKLATKPNISTSNVWVAAITIKTWNAWVNNKEVWNLRFRMLGDAPESFPEIKQPAQTVDIMESNEKEGTLK